MRLAFRRHRCKSVKEGYNILPKRNFDTSKDGVSKATDMDSALALCNADARCTAFNALGYWTTGEVEWKDDDMMCSYEKIGTCVDGKSCTTFGGASGTCTDGVCVASAYAKAVYVAGGENGDLFMSCEVYSKKCVTKNSKTSATWFVWNADWQLQVPGTRLCLNNLGRSSEVALASCEDAGPNSRWWLYHDEYLQTFENNPLYYGGNGAKAAVKLREIHCMDWQCLWRLVDEQGTPLRAPCPYRHDWATRPYLHFWYKVGTPKGGKAATADKAEEACAADSSCTAFNDAGYWLTQEIKNPLAPKAGMCTYVQHVEASDRGVVFVEVEGMSGSS
ncbi:hypothetical protein HYH03_018268 [Edaphochlamys debaryana]|uniref:Ricin B lectin domain-containing protein n=1 Tax=Edaphochlamys debaryana TaxID=47281 RepID=A0A836BN38_9CHLO|nr:hypothetical protein HYH03_018268 [Edaphochlamys debaryana]|eukprot:KAG2482831.1 hypothetical protein HYH03_018268 [Edaphochlamys debaryana]